MARRRKKRKNPSGGFGLALGGLVVGLALAGLYVSDAFGSPASPKPKPKPGDDSDGSWTDGDGTDGGGVIPDYKPVPGKKYAKGPKGKGRVYGQPNIALPDALFASNKVLVGPNCMWVVEGELFLPPVNEPTYKNHGVEYEYSNLFDTLQAETDEVLPTGSHANTAWGLVAWLVNNGDGKGDLSETLTQRLFDGGASLWKVSQDRKLPIYFPVGGYICASTSTNYLSDPLKNWRADIKSRVVGWLNEWFGVPFNPNA